MFNLNDLNYIAVLLATVASFLLGGWWYSPAGFGRAWLALVGKTIDDLGSPKVAMTATFIATFIAGLVLNLLIVAVDSTTFLGGAKVGLLAGLGLVAPAMFSDHLFGGQPLKLFLIQAGFRTVQMIVMGAILGAWL